MARCKDCIHYEPCYEYGNILDPIHGGVKCDSFKSAADVAPKSEVDLDALYDFQSRLRGIFCAMCDGNDYNKLCLLEIDSAIERLFDAFVAELKKKYTGEQTE